MSELCSILGLINYFAFPKGSGHPVTSPCMCYSGESPWKLKPECGEAFTKTKRLKSKVVVHYDTKKAVSLACDASPYGVGAVISHIMEDGEDKSIAFASHTLSNAESKYPQIEKEIPSIIFRGSSINVSTEESLSADLKSLLAILPAEVCDSHLSCPQNAKVGTNTHGLRLHY